MLKGDKIDIPMLAELYGVPEQLAQEAFSPVYLGHSSPGVMNFGANEHSGVLELERISKLTMSNPRDIGKLPDTTPEMQADYPLMKNIAHAKRCEACAAGIIRFASFASKY